MGGLLEKDIKRIFALAGFEVKTNVRLSGYEVDVYARRGGISIIIECKQYEKSEINIPNLIYTWSGKNKRIGASKVLLVVYGYKIPQKHLRLAKEEDVAIWSDKDLERFFDLTIEKGSESFSDIVSSLNIKTKNGVIEKWKPNIKAIKTLLNYWESELADGMPYSDYVIIALSNDNNYVFNPINDRYWIMHREKESMEIPTLTDNLSRKIQSFISSVYERNGDTIDTLIFPGYDSHGSIGYWKVHLAEEKGIKCLVGREIRVAQTLMRGISVLKIDDLIPPKKDDGPHAKMPELARKFLQESSKTKKSLKGSLYRKIVRN